MKYSSKASDGVMTTNNSNEIACTDGQYYLIDILKFVFAYLVIANHVPAFSNDSFQSAWIFNFFIRQCLARVTVPFYFASAGFLLFRKIPDNAFSSEIPISYVKKLLRLWGTWYILLFIGERAHLWFLPALAVATVLTGIMISFRLSTVTMVCITSVLYIFGLLGDSYNGFVTQYSTGIIAYINKMYMVLFGTTRNGIFMGLPLFFIGYLVSRNKINMRLHTAFIGLALSFAAMVAEAFLLEINNIPVDYNMYLANPLVTFFLLYLSTHIKLKPSKAYKRIRIYGMLIYYSHLFFKQSAIWLFQIVEKLTDYSASGLLIFLSTVVLSTVFAICVSAMSNKPAFRHMKYLYS